MKWTCLVGALRDQPGSGAYSDWKSEIAKHCGHQCIYCAIAEHWGGGERNFHVEHFRPKQKFPELENRMSNLFYACAICNSFKGSDWPADPLPELDEPSYADPSSVDYNEHVRISPDWSLESEFATFQYMIERLFLNRPQLIVARRRVHVIESIIEIEEELVGLLLRMTESTGLIDADTVREAILLNQSLGEVVRALQTARPYEREDLKKP